MEQIIAKLLKDFEHGKMTRRQLIESLALTVTAASAAQTSAADSKGLQAISVNHTSYGVLITPGRATFMPTCSACGSEATWEPVLSRVRRHVHPRAQDSAADNKPDIDHIAITIDNWNKDAVEAELKCRGLQPRPDTDTSFRVNDPDGFDLQISGRRPKA